jgi:hypothetical protein
MKEQYINFDEYIRQGEPEQQEKAGYWQTAIGIQTVDGLKVSSYLQDTARKHIEGELTIDEVNNLLDKHYKEKRARKAVLKEYETYTRVDSVNPVESRMGRPITSPSTAEIPVNGKGTSTS